MLSNPPYGKSWKSDLETGEAVEIGDDVVLSSKAFRQIVETIEKTLRDRGSATVSELRKAIGTSRRIAVLLLEYLDRIGLRLCK